MVVLPALASMVAGCADSRMTANNADAQASQPYQAGYGMSSNGPTTDLYTELFRGGSRDDKNAPATAAAAPPPPGQPAVASNTVQRGQPAGTVQRGQSATVASAVPPGQPATAPSVAPQEPPPPPAVPTAYGISSNGPTTDLYTEIFGPHN